MAEPFPLAPSLWAATAPAGPLTPPLDVDRTAAVCIVGGGFAGLSAALHLAEAGIETVLLEAHEAGWGASGRNGGQVIPGLKYDPDVLRAKFPGDAGDHLVDFAGRTADTVFDLIARHRMDVPHRRAGWVQGAHTEAGLNEVASRAEQWARQGADVAVLDRAETAEHLGSNAYLGGWVDRRGGAVQPLAYARGMARAAQGAGAALHGQSPVSAMHRQSGKWHVQTEAGRRVVAERVLVCTNGYSGPLIPKLARTVVAMNSFQVATAPLSDNVRATILPFGHVCSDTRKLLLYFRLDPDGRLIMGGRGRLSEPQSASDWAHLERVVGKVFPQAGGTPIAYRWGGRVALTRDFLPHLHEPEPGLLVDIGCMGRGIGLQSLMGQAMARYVETGDRRALPFPVVPIQPIPMHAMRRLYVSAIIAWYRMNDGGMKQAV